MKKGNNIHIGKLIKQKMEERHVSVSDFAEQLYYERTNVYKIFKRESVDANLLIRISEILRYNFLEEIYLQHFTMPSRYFITIELETAVLYSEDMQRFLALCRDNSVNIIHKKEK